MAIKTWRDLSESTQNILELVEDFSGNARVVVMPVTYKDGVEYLHSEEGKKFFKIIKRDVDCLHVSIKKWNDDEI